MYQAEVTSYDQYHSVEQKLEVAASDFRAGGIHLAQIRRDILPALDHHADREIVADILLGPKSITAGTDGIRDSMVTLSRPPESSVILVQDQIGGGEQRASGCLPHELAHVFTLSHRKRLGFDAKGHSGDDHDLMFRTITRRSARVGSARLHAHAARKPLSIETGQTQHVRTGRPHYLAEPDAESGQFDAGTVGQWLARGLPRS